MAAIDLIKLFAVLLGIISAVLLILAMRKSVQVNDITQDRFRNVLNVDAAGADGDSEFWLPQLFNRLGLRRFYMESEASLRRQMDQAGITHPEMRVFIYGGHVVSPWLFAVLAAVYAIASGYSAGQVLMSGLWGTIFGYMAPRYLVRYLTGIRRRNLRDEALMMIHLLQMMFEAGLSIEQALRTLRSQAGILLPHMRSELDRVLNRIEAGMDRASVFDEWADEVGVREVSDLAELLSQLSRQGGNIQKSLAEMAVLMEDRNRTELREKVGKLSGKMTVVMVLFLFPALMIFVAGPGVMSITSALGGLR